MALTFVEMYKIAGSQALPQLPAAVAIVAVEVLNEDPATEQHPARIVWAQKALLDPMDMARKMTWGLLADVSVSKKWPDISDDDARNSIQALVNGYLNA